MKIKLYVTVLFSVCVAISFGCATKSSQPGWIAGEDAKYNKKDYLLGRGQAATLEEAQSRARADLAQIFQAAVRPVGENAVKSKSNSTVSGTVQFSSDSGQRISTHIKQVIKGIQIAEIWNDPSSQSIAVLAVLPRHTVEENLRNQIRQFDDLVQSSLDQSRSQADWLFRINVLNKAIAPQVERESLQNVLQVVDSTGRGVVSPTSSDRLRIDLTEMFKRVRISPRILSGSAPGLEEMVSGALSHAGFSIDQAEPDYLVKASLKLADIGIVDGWYWQRGSLELSVSETATGRVRGTRRWAIKGSGRERVSAIRRSLDEAGEVLKKELGTTITGMANLK